VDNCRNTDNPVAAGIGEQLHNGRFHPYPAGDSRYRRPAQFHTGSQNHIADKIS